ncbi:glycoside hydrolase family 19 protein [Aeromonas popoffii]|uniref:glycoside hydrolase family 19 protein n=1 Tax=Aeromonas popoffii TaxID=70856 RepID=UPI0030D1F2C3
MYTSPSFCLVRHHYEAGEQNKNRLTFYSLYMHIACENTYSSPEAARVTVKGSGVSTYEPVAHLKLTRRLSGSHPVYAKTGAEVKLLQQTPSNLLNHRDEAHDYFLVHYVDEPNSPFYIAQSQLQHEYPQKPTWMTPPEGKPARHGIPGNTWLRQTADTTAGSLGLPAGSEVVVSGESQMVALGGGSTEFRKVQVFKAGSGTVKDSANQVMANASKGAIGWLATSKMGAGLAAEPSLPVQFEEAAPVVDRSENPIAVQAGEVIGHWGEHQIAKAGASGLVKDADSKAVHFEVFVAGSDKQALEDCINNKARVSGGQGYLLVKQEVTTYRLTSDSQHGFHDVAKFGPLVLPLAVKESDKVSHGANNFVKVRERTAADGELAGEFVLLADGVEVVSQHDWHKLGVKLVDGSSDEDGFLDKADTATDSEESQQKEASEFFSTLYDKLVTDRDNDGTLSGNDIKAALADEELAGKLRMLFIKHKSEWVKPGDWPRLKQELADQPKLYEYAMQVHNNMAWMEDASAILGDTKPWFIHPAGMMGLLAPVVFTSIKCHKCQKDISLSFEFMRTFTPSSVSDSRLHDFIARWNESAISYGINSCEQVINLLGQGKHETKRFTAFRESLVYRSYTAESLYSMAPTAINNGFARKGLSLSRDEKMDYIKRHLLNNDAGYGEHAFGSNEFPGKDYRGRGLLHLTHAENYRLCALATGLNIYSNPELVESDMSSIVLSGFWFWSSNNLGSIADSNVNHLDKVKKITKIINPGLKGLEERVEFTAEARELHVRLFGECN